MKQDDGSVLAILAAGAHDPAEPRPECPYAPLIGSWDVTSTGFGPDGAILRGSQNVRTTLEVYTHV